MDVPNQVPVAKPLGEADAPRVRHRAPAPRVVRRSPLERLRVPPVMVIIVALIIGLIVGGLLIRQRYKSQEVVASVNGALIKESDFLHRLDIASDVAKDEPAGPKILRRMVDELLLVQFAKQNGAMPTPQEVDAEYAMTETKPGFKLNMNQLGLSPDDVKMQLRFALANDYLLTKGITVTADEAQQFYQVNINPKNQNPRFYTPVQAQFAVIPTQSQALAMQAVEELKQGVDYSLVATKYSMDNSYRTKETGGLMPMLLRGQNAMSTIPGWENAAFSLEKDETIGPRPFLIDNKTTWWIIRCVDKQPAQVIPFETVQRDCVLGAKLTKVDAGRQQELAANFQKFKHSSKIVPFWPRYKGVFQQ